VYVADQGGSVLQFDVGPGGALAAKAPASVAAGSVARQVAVSPDGTSVYVSNQAGSSISQYDVGAGGLLAAKSPATVSVASTPAGIAVSPDGRSLYVAYASIGGDLGQFDIGPGGLLSAKSPAAVETGSNVTFDVAQLPSQSPLASFAAQAAAAGSPTAFDATGSSDSDGAVARYDWDFGDGSSLANGGPVPAHVYPQPGTYTARLTVTDDDGCSAARVFTGRTTHCSGGASVTERAVTIPSAGPGATVTRGQVRVSLLRRTFRRRGSRLVRLGLRMRLRGSAPPGFEAALCATLRGRVATRRGLRPRAYGFGSCAPKDSRRLRSGLQLVRTFKCSTLGRLRAASLRGRVVVFDAAGRRLFAVGASGRRAARRC
jgi:PKD domain/Lactonase, 7-bladed beta-propeller